MKRTPCPSLVSDGAEKGCAIYPVKPKGCRAFPIETRLGTGGVRRPGAEVFRRRLEECDDLPSEDEAWLLRL